MSDNTSNTSKPEGETIPAREFVTNPPEDADMIALHMSHIFYVAVESGQIEPDTGYVILTCSNGRDYRVHPDEPLRVDRWNGELIDLTGQPAEDIDAPNAISIGDLSALFTVGRDALPPMDEIHVEEDAFDGN